MNFLRPACVALSRRRPGLSLTTIFNTTTNVFGQKFFSRVFTGYGFNGDDTK